MRDIDIVPTCNNPLIRGADGPAARHKPHLHPRQQDPVCDRPRHDEERADVQARGPEVQRQAAQNGRKRLRAEEPCPADGPVALAAAAAAATARTTAGACSSVAQICGRGSKGKMKRPRQGSSQCTACGPCCAGWGWTNCNSLGRLCASRCKACALCAGRGCRERLCLQHSGLSSWQMSPSDWPGACCALLVHGTHAVHTCQPWAHERRQCASGSWTAMARSLHMLRSASMQGLFGIGHGQHRCQHCSSH